MNDFFRYPQTPHLAWLGAAEPRADKVLTQAGVRQLLAHPVTVEEKVDGANLGFSIGPDGHLRAQNRGQYLIEPHAGQFRRLPRWLAVHEAGLRAALTADLIAFGEWCAARHSLPYDRLPDWWLLFDIYDRREQRFWSTRRRNAWAEQAGVRTVARVAHGRQSLASLRALLINTRSNYRDGDLEGLVLRLEDEDWLQARAKLVRADFIQNIETHWRSQPLEWNRLT